MSFMQMGTNLLNHFDGQMQSFQHPPQQALFPIRNPPVMLGASSNFCYQYPETFKLTEGMLRSDSFTVDGARGPFLEVQPATFSMHDRKKFFHNGRPIFDLRKRSMHLHATYEGCDPNDDDKVFFTVKKHFKFAGSHLVISLRNMAQDGQEIELEMLGDWREKNVQINWNGQLVGSISRQALTWRHFLGDADTYYLSVAPGVDAAMLCAAAIVFDELFHDEGRR